MAKITTLIPQRNKGVLLTLGITFLALVVLTLATLILRNAETSEDRLVELGGMDRIYNLGSSTERSLINTLYPYTGLNFSAINGTVTFERQMHPYPDTTLWNIESNFFDYKLMLKEIIVQYISSVSKDVNTLKETDGINDRLLFFLQPSLAQYWLTNIPINITDTGYPNFLINDPSGETNSTYHLFYTIQNTTKIKEFIFYFKHDTRVGLINWSDNGNGRILHTTEPEKQVKVTVIVDGPIGILPRNETWSDIDILGTGELFTNVIYIDNLTGDQGCIPPPVGCTVEVPDRRPTVRMSAGALPQITGGILLPIHLFIIANFQEELFTRVTVALNHTYTEIYGTQQITTELPAFKMKRVRPARYL